MEENYKMPNEKLMSIEQEKQQLVSYWELIYRERKNIKKKYKIYI